MKKKVLIFPAGTEIAFEIVNALKFSKFVELYGGTSEADHSEFVYLRLIEGFPYVNEDGFLDYLNKTIEEYGIDCIYPAHDSVSVFLSDHVDEIKAQVIITDKKTTSICRSKEETYLYFKDCDFIPKTYADISEIKEYPVFVKPKIGQGSVGAQKVNSENELKMLLNEKSDLIVAEYLQGMEYTVDCFTDMNGKLLVSNIRDRQRIRAGISVRSEKIPLDSTVKQIAECINDKLDFKGAWFFQLKKDINGKYKLLEISPRIPGTMGLSRNMGINFPMLTLFVFWGYSVEILENDYDIIVDRAFYSSYRISHSYEHVYIDYDDTLTLNGKVNSFVMMYLYQAHNEGKVLHLLSRHRGDLMKDMEEICISQKLFDEILLIGESDRKSDYITEKNAIFIDDSFAERKNVKDKLGIDVFDVDMIEALINRKM